MEECRKGNHPLIELTRTWLGYGGEEVVRWCPECGSVVVDVDVDGRTMAGKIMKMKSPQVIKWNKSKGSV